MLRKSPTAVLTEHAERIAAHLENQIGHANAMADYLLSLPEADLADWLNREDRRPLFASHYAAGCAMNSLAEAMEDSMTGIKLSRVDVSDFIAKAAARGLSITADETGWHVARIQTEPQPELTDTEQ